MFYVCDRVYETKKIEKSSLRRLAKLQANVMGGKFFPPAAGKAMP